MHTTYRRSTTLLLFALSIAITSPRAPAQDNNAPEDQTACRQAVEQVMSAIEAGDGDTLRELLWADRRHAAQFEGLAAIIDCIVAQHALDQAMTQRWGPDPQRPGGQTTFLPADRDSVRNARVDLQSDIEALLILSPNVSPITLRCNRFDRRWRVVLQVVQELNDNDADRSPEIGSQRRIEYLRTVVRALEQARQKVVKGAFDSPASVRASIQKLLTAAGRRHRSN